MISISYNMSFWNYKQLYYIEGKKHDRRLGYWGVWHQIWLPILYFLFSKEYTYPMHMTLICEEYCNSVVLRIIYYTFLWSNVNLGRKENQEKGVPVHKTFHNMYYNMCSHHMIREIASNTNMKSDTKILR